MSSCWTSRYCCSPNREPACAATAARRGTQHLADRLDHEIGLATLDVVRASLGKDPPPTRRACHDLLLPRDPLAVAGYFGDLRGDAGDLRSRRPWSAC